MYQHYTKSLDTFSLEGQVLDFIYKKNNNQIKYLRLGTASKEYHVKIAKEIRASLSEMLRPGLTIKVAGEKKINQKTGELKLKAYQVTPVNKAVKNDQVERVNNLQVVPNRNKREDKPSNKILVCSKSDCCKRGALRVCQMLADSLNEHNLGAQVIIQKTGCLKDCKAGPNLVVMPDKTRYNHVKPTEVTALVTRHFVGD